MNSKPNLKVSQARLTKLDVQDILEHILRTLREFDGNLLQERQAVDDGNEVFLQSVIEDRVGLLNLYRKWQQQFFGMAKKLFSSFDFNEVATFAENIAVFRGCLAADDLELLLLCDQLEAILKQIELQSASLVEFIENKQFSSQLIPVAQLQAAKKFCVAVGVMEEDLENELSL